MLVGTRGAPGGVPHSSSGSCSQVEFDIRLFTALGGQVLSRDCLRFLGLKGEVSRERCGVSFAAWGLRDEVRGFHCDEGVSCVMCQVEILSFKMWQCRLTTVSAMPVPR